MQRKALKQLNKVTQWTHEKVFSGEKTQLSSDFLNFEKEVDVARIGIERMHATSMPFFENVTKVKPSADPQASSKDKILLGEALGLVMTDHGGDIKGAYGDALAKYGRARGKLAIAQEEFGGRLRENYIAGMERSMEAVNEYKTFRKKLDSRRLALDAAISKLNSTKKEKDIRGLEMEVEMARERFEEVEEETAARMEVIQNEQEQQYAELADLMEAEMEYFAKCKEIMDELRDSWPSGSVTQNTSNRPRAKSNASSRSATRSRNRPSAPASSDEEANGHRTRSQSNASASSKGEKRRSMLPSFGSFGRKSGLSASAKPKRKERYGDEGRLPSEPEDSDEDDEPLSPRQQFAMNGRTRSTGTVGSSSQLVGNDSPSYGATPPPMRRTYTSPSNLNARYVKAIYAYAATKEDELSLRSGMIVEVKSEISQDWWIGEAEGRSGMFPSAYCEPYTPSPTSSTAASGVPPPMPKRSLPPQVGISTRNLPPPVRSAPTSALSTQSHLPPSPTNDFHFTSDSELSQGYDDADHFATASLATAAPPSLSSHSEIQPNRSRASTITKKAPPPPPPASRRSQSSTNIFGSSGSGYNTPPGGLAPPPMLGTVGRNRSNTGNAVRNFSLDSSPEGSPFMGSEDEDYFDRDDRGLTGAAATSAGQGIRGGDSPGGVGGVTAGMGGLVLPRQAAGGAGTAEDCSECGCEDFTQNVFKPKGMCSTCYHQH